MNAPGGTLSPMTTPWPSTGRECVPRPEGVTGPRLRPEQLGPSGPGLRPRPASPGHVPGALPELGVGTLLCPHTGLTGPNVPFRHHPGQAGLGPAVTSLPGSDLADPVSTRSHSEVLGRGLRPPDPWGHSSARPRPPPCSAPAQRHAAVSVLPSRPTPPRQDGRARLVWAGRCRGRRHCRHQGPAGSRVLPSSGFGRPRPTRRALALQREDTEQGGGPACPLPRHPGDTLLPHPHV